MKKKLPFLLILTMIMHNISLSQVTENFEDETVGATQLTLNGAVYTLTGDLLISQFNNFSCDGNVGTNNCIDTGFGNDNSSGVFGSIVAPLNTTFELSTTSSQCGWTGTEDGNLISTGTIRFIGTKTDNTEIQEEFTLETTSVYALVSFTFSSAIWSGVELKKLTLEIINGMNYWAMDNLVFESLTLSIDENSQNQEIQIFPTKTSNHIKINGLKSPIDYKIYNILGLEVKGGTISNQEKIVVEEFSNGIYFLKLKNVDTIKFIKK